MDGGERSRATLFLPALPQSPGLPATPAFRSPAGTFSGVTGRSNCLACPAGSYQDETGQQECKASWVAG